MKLHAGLLLVLTTVFLLAGLNPVRAQDPLCEPGLWDQMRQRATLLGQMDTATVENLVYKPDSVFEYNCFNRFMDVSAANMTYYMRPFYVTDVIQPGIVDYLSRNFGHTYLGGRTDPQDPATPPAAGAAYVCDAMTYVWEIAKCMNFAHIEPQDSIYGLHEFAAADDIRRIPAPVCTAPDSAAYGVLPVTGAALNPNLPPAGTGTGIECGTPISTGLVIDQPVGPNDGGRPQRFNEKICPNPACNYTPTGLDTGDCAP